MTWGRMQTHHAHCNPQAVLHLLVMADSSTHLAIGTSAQQPLGAVWLGLNVSERLISQALLSTSGLLLVLNLVMAAFKVMSDDRTHLAIGTSTQQPL